MSANEKTLKAQIEQLKKENRELRASLLKDDLTGLGNYRSFTEDLQRLFNDNHKSVENSKRSSVALLFIDVDHFKQVNQTHGHWAASRLLSAMGRRIFRTIRESDQAYRYGGDEFIVLVSGPKKNIQEMADRIKNAISAKPFEVAGFQGRVKVNLSVSLGVRVLTPHDSPVQIIEEADRALFAAKRRQKTESSIAA